MFSSNSITKSTKSCSASINELCKAIKNGAIIIEGDVDKVINDLLSNIKAEV